jgi:mannonate dehydratase
LQVMLPLLREQKRRKEAGDAHWRLPLRPDHGHQLLDDDKRATHPGYPLYGRMRGLAELRGVMTALASIEGLPL